MKLRLGFVSNSSSSSYVVVTTNEMHEEALRTLHPYIQAVVESVIREPPPFTNIETGSIFPHALIIWSYFQGRDEESEWVWWDSRNFGADPPPAKRSKRYKMTPDEAIGLYLDKLEELGAISTGRKRP